MKDTFKWRYAMFPEHACWVVVGPPLALDLHRAGLSIFDAGFVKASQLRDTMEDVLVAHPLYRFLRHQQEMEIMRVALIRIA